MWTRNDWDTNPASGQSEDCLVSCAGGRFRPRPDHHSGSLKNWEEMLLFIVLWLLQTVRLSRLLLGMKNRRSCLTALSRISLWDVKEPTPLFEKSRGRRPRVVWPTLSGMGGLSVRRHLVLKYRDNLLILLRVSWWLTVNSLDSLYVYNIFIMITNVMLLVWHWCVEFVFFGGHFEFCSQVVRGLELKHLRSCSGKWSDLSRVFRQSQVPRPQIILVPRASHQLTEKLKMAAKVYASIK